MNRALSLKKRLSRSKNALLSLLVVLAMLLVALSSETYARATLNGVKLWAFNIVPSVFPYFVLTALLTSLGSAAKLASRCAGLSRRLFGCGSSEGRALPSRLIFSDSVLGKSPSPLDEYSRAVEIKSENTISRLTAIANPRQMERVIRNSCFNVDILYEISHAVDDYLTETAEDLETLGTGFRLLSLDYLGGSGSRGYGRVAFENFSVEVCYGSVAPEELQLWRESFIAATGTVPAEENGA